MIQRLVRLLYPYGSNRRVLRGPAKGMRFTVEPGIGFTYAMGTNTATPREFQNWIRPGMTVFDLGANKGQMALLFASIVGSEGRVYCFEPAAAEFQSLSKNIECNGIGSSVRAIEAAASDTIGESAFTYAVDHPTQGKLLEVEKSYSTPDAETQIVNTITLDSMVEETGLPDFIKIDVEGAAASVLRGAAKLLEEGQPFLYLELHGPEEQAGVRDELIARGYVAQTLDGTVVSDPTTTWQSPLICFKPDEKQ